jgi:hypothetical protein
MQACHKKNSLAACKAVCFGRTKNQSACQQLRILGSGG